jgi:hypothetical protein
MRRLFWTYTMSNTLELYKKYTSRIRLIEMTELMKS